MFAKQLWYTNNFIQCIFLKGNCHLYLHWEISRTISNLMGLSQILVDMEFGKAMDPALMSFSTKSAEPHMMALKRGVRPSYSDELSDDPRPSFLLMKLAACHQMLPLPYGCNGSVDFCCKSNSLTWLQCGNDSFCILLICCMVKCNAFLR